MAEKRPASKAPKVGGRLQRFRAAEPVLGGDHDPHNPTPVLADDEFDSELAKHLLKDWSWGHLSACKVQQIALQSYRDQEALLERVGLSKDHASKSLMRLARLGSWGKFSGNCHHDLITFLGEPSLPKPLEHKMPLTIPKMIVKEGIDLGVAKVVRQKQYPILLPHVLFNHYYSTNRARFDELFLGNCKSDDDLESFWNTLRERNDPRLKGHPMCRKAGWMRKTIPFSFHGDGVPVLQVGKSGSKSVDVYSLQSLLNTTGSSDFSKILITMVFTANRADGTETEIWRVLLWSLHWMAMGKWPQVDWNFKEWPQDSPEAQLVGRPLAGGYCGVLYTIKADLDFLAKVLKLRHYNAHEPCELCPAHRDAADRGGLYNNFSDDARWMESLYDVPGWLKIHEDGVPHPIFMVLGVSHYSVEPDELHILYLGVLQYLLGSLLYLMTFKLLPSSPQANLDKIWSMVIKFYREHAVPVQFSSLTLSSFCKESDPASHYPQLKGKGAELRDAVAPIEHVWRTLVPNDYHQKEEIGKALAHLLQCQDILHAYRLDYFLPVAEVASFRQHINSFLVLYQGLAARADLDHELLFSQPTKFHWLWHLGERSMYLNPRRSNTMIDEDFVGRMKDLIAACSAGTELDRMAPNAMQKYRYGFEFLSKFK